MSGKQKQDELRFVEIMRQVLGGVPEGSLTQPSPPEPDAVIESSLGRIGIEVTELYAGPVGKLKASEEDGIMARTVDELRKRGILPLEFVVYWNAHYNTGKADRPIAMELADIIARRDPAVGTCTVLGSEYGYDEFFQHRAIDRIEVARWGEYEDFAWGSPRVGRPIPLPYQIIQWALDRKNGKPKDYKADYWSRWLLIVAEGADPSSWVQYSEELAHHNYTTTFNRVVFLDCLKRRAITVHRDERAA